MKKVQHEKVNIMQYCNTTTSNSATLKATTFKSGTLLVQEK